MTQEQADFLESVALTVEANPDFYNQQADPSCSDTSCGCLIHFMRWMAGTTSEALSRVTGLTHYEMDLIYVWKPDGCFYQRETTADEGAAYIRSIVRAYRGSGS